MRNKEIENIEEKLRDMDKQVIRSGIHVIRDPERERRGAIKQ